MKTKSCSTCISVNMCLLVVFWVCNIGAICGWSVCVASGEVVIVEGNGFKLTEEDVVKVKSYYDKTQFRTTGAEYHHAALKTKLMAHEAKMRHIDKEVDVSLEETETVEAWNLLANAYLRKVLEEYPVSDLVIESYYRAFPERFEDYEHAENASSQKYIDAELKQHVRRIIVNCKKDAIIVETIENLKIKYGIVYITN